ncbi:MAG: Lrp/AsnC family transcriptional regulator [Gammaproteobacteria bacterium]|nr:Lrp/AsnC family transcriptional regulator [Gammaproteobacteria bacterium]
MDRIDKKILTLLQDNGRLSNQELADEIALSPSPCLRRVKALEDNGIIQKYVALLDPESLALQLTVMVSVGLDKHSPERMRQFELSIKKIPEVIQCYLITGQSADYLLKVIVTNMQHYQKVLLERITQIDGVTSVHSSFVLQKIVDKTNLPLDFV